jgi:hypothetical protein
MNDTPNLSSILDTPTSEAERPRPLPTGTYICSVGPEVTFGASSQKGTEFVAYKLQPLDVLRDKKGDTDVDENELEDMGGIGSLRPVTVNFYLTVDSAFRHRKFLDDLGVPDRDGKERDPKKQDLTHRQRALMAPGCQVVANFRHEPSQDGQSMFPRLNYSAPVE